MTTGIERDIKVRDWLVPFLLLCLRDGQLRGHELTSKMADFGFGAVRPGEVYRSLRRAEENALVFSEREAFGYLLSRRRYGLTEPGEAYIEFLADSLGSYQKEISAFLHAYRERPVRGVYG